MNTADRRKQLEDQLNEVKRKIRDTIPGSPEDAALQQQYEDLSALKAELGPEDQTSAQSSDAKSKVSRTIQAGGDYFEHVEGDVYAGDGNVKVGDVSIVGGDKVEGDQIAVTTGNISGNGMTAIGKEIHQTKITIHNPPEPSQSEDPTPLREAYLRRLLKDVSHVMLSGIDPQAAGQEVDASLDLSAIYTALLTTIMEPAEHNGSERYDGSILHAKRQGRRLSALAQLDRYPRLVLLGDPGSGKSTFVNFVAMCLAGELVQHPTVNRLLLTTPLPNDEGEDEDQRQPWSHKNVLPVRVILRDFAATGLPRAGQPATADHLWAFLAKDLKTPLGDYAPYFQQQLTSSPGGLLLLDGLDEVPEAETRRTQIKETIEDFAAVFPHCRMLVTSRTYAYQKQDWRLHDFTETVLAPFTDGQIRRFVDRWYQHIAGRRGIPRDEAKGRAERLKQKIFSRAALAELAQRPLLLALMASLYAWRGCELPEKRVELYKATVDLLLDCWEQGKRVMNERGEIILQHPSLSEFLNVGKERVLMALQTLAFQAHISQSELTGTANIRQKELVDTLMQICQNEDVRPRQLEKYLWDRAGVLIPHGVGLYTFPHRTFQEYLAACHLSDDADFPHQLVTVTNQEPNRWREVVMLVGGAVKPFMRRVLVEAFCPQDVDTMPATQENAWGALLAAQVLDEAGDLVHRSTSTQKLLPRIQAWLVAILTERQPADAPFPTTERALAGNLLAVLDDPRPGITLREEGLPDIEWCNVPAGTFTMGSDPEKDHEANKGEQPQHTVQVSAFWISRYPVTNAQYQSFVDHGGYTDQWRECWSQEGWTWKEERQITEPERYGGEFDLPNHPVVGVSWYETSAFCQWLTLRFREAGELSESQEIRLPTEAEWEKAARGEDGRIYSWGNEISPDFANYRDTGLGVTSTGGCFPRGKSPYGCEEMAGNVWEWCLDKCELDDDFNIVTDTYKDGLVDPVSMSGSYRVLRGGFWYTDARFVRAAFRSWHAPDGRRGGVGFRLVRTPS